MARVERLLPIYARDFRAEGRMKRLRREVIETAGVPKPTSLDLQLAWQIAPKGRAAALIHRSQGRSGEDLQAEIELAGSLAEEGLGEFMAVLFPREVPANTGDPAPVLTHVEDAASARKHDRQPVTMRARRGRGRGWRWPAHLLSSQQVCLYPGRASWIGVDA